jgi:CTP:molybdopterin cytidylyltransferase MocA
MERQQRVAAVILAAGESRRFGSPKQLARLGKRTLLEHVLDLARDADLDPIITVVPAWLHDRDPGVSWVVNDQPEWGMSHSLRLGIAALPYEVAAALILLGDQPTLSAGAIAALLAARGDKPIVATSESGRLGAPVLVERSHFGVVEQPRGDIGLREILAAYPELVRPVELGEHAPDVDTPADLRALRDG